ncbi:hypothetical protein EVG20_g7626 [Dentipellis fragilis]|uniref:Uncharacterized protein n=1 Tax=Dentipellis fragilis TaxID=205917 RepID=A0A4Y9YBI4_9AGAM|nr:hypothetical protein EVG20_g7626 [Dentipellis fragilis]
MSPCGEKYYTTTVTLKITLIELWATSAFHGLYTALFAGSVYVLVFHQPRRYYLAISILLYILITANVIVGLVQIILTPTFISNSRLVDGVYVVCGLEADSESPDQIRQALLNDFTEVAIDFINTFAQITADGLLIYRCWIIWNRTLRIVIPVTVLLLATTACNLSVVYYSSQIYTMRRAANPPASLPSEWPQRVRMASVFSTTSYALALSTTVITTALIAGRIWWTSRIFRRSSATSGGIYKSAIAILIESGAIYSSGLIVALIVRQTTSKYWGIFSSSVSPLLGIAPTLIIVRVGLGHSFETTDASVVDSTPIPNTGPVSSAIVFAAGHPHPHAEPAGETRFTVPIRKVPDGDSVDMLDEAEKELFFKLSNQKNHMSEDMIKVKRRSGTDSAKEPGGRTRRRHVFRLFSLLEGSVGGNGGLLDMFRCDGISARIRSVQQNLLFYKSSCSRAPWSAASLTPSTQHAMRWEKLSVVDQRALGSECSTRSVMHALNPFNADSPPGLYTALFIGSAYILALQRPKRYYLVTSIFLYILITTNIILGVVEILLTPIFTTHSHYVNGANFVCGSESTETPAQTHEAVVSDMLDMFGDITDTLSQITADGLLIYRCFIIWDRKKHILLSLMALLLATAACNFSNVYYDYRLYKLRDITDPSTPLPPERNRLVNMSVVFGTTGDALVLFTTVVTTVVTAGRIWWTSRRIGRNLGQTIKNIYKSAIMMIVESGAIYSSGIIITIIARQTTLENLGVFGSPVTPLLVSCPIGSLLVQRVMMTTEGNRGDFDHRPRRHGSVVRVYPDIDNQRPSTARPSAFVMQLPLCRIDSRSGAGCDDEALIDVLAYRTAESGNADELGGVEKVESDF